MRTLTVTVVNAAGAVLATTTIRVPNRTRRLEIVPGAPAEGPYRVFGELRIGPPRRPPHVRRGS